QRAIAEMAVAVFAEVARGDVRRKEGDALGRLRSGKPDEREAAGVEDAIFRRNANLCDALFGDAEQDVELAGTFEMESFRVLVGMVGGDVVAIGMFETAFPAKVIAIGEVAATSGVLAGQPLNRIGDPSGSFGAPSDLFNGGAKTSRDGLRLQLGI